MASFYQERLPDDYRRLGKCLIRVWYGFCGGERWRSFYLPEIPVFRFSSCLGCHIKTMSIYSGDTRGNPSRVFNMKNMNFVYIFFVMAASTVSFVIVHCSLVIPKKHFYRFPDILKLTLQHCYTILNNCFLVIYRIVMSGSNFQLLYNMLPVVKKMFSIISHVSVRFLQRSNCLDNIHIFFSSE